LVFLFKLGTQAKFESCADDSVRVLVGHDQFVFVFLVENIVDLIKYQVSAFRIEQFDDQIVPKSRKEEFSEVVHTQIKRLFLVILLLLGREVVYEVEPLFNQIVQVDF